MNPKGKSRLPGAVPRFIVDFNRPQEPEINLIPYLGSAFEVARQTVTGQAAPVSDGQRAAHRKMLEESDLGHRIEQNRVKGRDEREGDAVSEMTVMDAPLMGLGALAVRGLLQRYGMRAAASLSDEAAQTFSEAEAVMQKGPANVNAVPLPATPPPVNIVHPSAQTWMPVAPVVPPGTPPIPAGVSPRDAIDMRQIVGTESYATGANGNLAYITEHGWSGGRGSYGLVKSKLTPGGTVVGSDNEVLGVIDPLRTANAPQLNQNMFPDRNVTLSASNDMPVLGETRAKAERGDVMNVLYHKNGWVDIDRKDLTRHIGGTQVDDDFVLDRAIDTAKKLKEDYPGSNPMVVATNGGFGIVNLGKQPWDMRKIAAVQHTRYDGIIDAAHLDIGLRQNKGTWARRINPKTGDQGLPRIGGFGDIDPFSEDAAITSLVTGAPDRAASTLLRRADDYVMMPMPRLSRQAGVWDPGMDDLAQRDAFFHQLMPNVKQYWKTSRGGMADTRTKVMRETTNPEWLKATLDDVDYAMSQAGEKYGWAIAHEIHPQVWNDRTGIVKKLTDAGYVNPGTAIRVAAQRSQMVESLSNDALTRGLPTGSTIEEVFSNYGVGLSTYGTHRANKAFPTPRAMYWMEWKNRPGIEHPNGPSASHFGERIFSPGSVPLNDVSIYRAVSDKVEDVNVGGDVMSMLRFKLSHVPLPDAKRGILGLIPAAAATRAMYGFDAEEENQ
jgi:hypothetical protein